MELISLTAAEIRRISGNGPKAEAAARAERAREMLRLLDEIQQAADEACNGRLAEFEPLRRLIEASA